MIEKIIEDFGKFNIFVLGDIVLDKYLFGETNYISQEAPVPIVKATHDKYVLGGAANVAMNFKKANCNVWLAGVVGHDKHGSQISDLIKKHNINPVLAYDFGRITTVKKRVICQNQQMIRIDYESTDDVDIGLLDKYVFDVMRSIDIDAIVIADYNKGVLHDKVISKVLELAHEKNIFIAIDPKIKNFALYNNVDLFKPNIKEFFIHYSRYEKNFDNLVKLVPQFAMKLNISNMIVTMGGNGITAYNGKNLFHVPALNKTEVYDVTGAGDTVITYIVLSLLSNLSLVEASIVASVAAALKIRHLGAGPIDIEELKAKLINFDEYKKLVNKII